MTFVDLTLRCPVCGRRADVCFTHGDDWKQRRPLSVQQHTEAQLRAGVDEFTQDDPPPYPPPRLRQPTHEPWDWAGIFADEDADDRRVMP